MIVAMLPFLMQAAAGPPPSVPAPAQAAPIPPSPMPPAAAPPLRPLKRWTAEELTVPILHYSCDLLGHDGRRGRLDFVVTGGRAFPDSRADRQVVPGFGRTKQQIRFVADELQLFHGPKAEEVSVWPTTGKFFVQFTAPDPPAPPYGSKTWRSVLISYNYGMPLAISVNAVPRAQMATGFCTVRTEPQAPLTREEAARETSA